MKQIFILSACFLAACAGEEKKTEEGNEVNDVRVIDTTSILSGCYTAVLQKDTANLVLQHEPGAASVSGDLVFNNFETDDPFVSKERAQLELALALLPEKNRAITFTYLTLEDEQGRIPSDIRNSLAKTFGVLPDSLPSIKRRTIKDLINKIDGYK